MTALPFVTVIVPSYNRAALLRDAIESLVAQEYPPDRMEVVVVDDASTDHTGEVVSEIARRAPFELRYQRRPVRRGPAATRNTGVRIARGEILAFTDSDCRPSPGWLCAGVAAFRDPAVGLVSGPIRPVTNPDRWPGLFHHQIPETRGEDPFYPTANVFFRKHPLVQLGGFNEGFGFYFWGSLVSGEDTDMAWRVKRAGYASAFAPAALVEHEATALSFTRWLAESIRSQIFPYLVSRYPELRREALVARCFVYRDAPAFYLAVAGLAVAMATGFKPALAAVLPLLWGMRSLAYYDLPYPARWWKIPAKYALHLLKLSLNMAALWYGSLRVRALVI